MKPEALEQAHRALSKAERAFERMSSPDEDVRDAWEDFLQAVARVFEKTKQAARGDAKAWNWFKKKLDERRDDPLLAYVHHARNADYHGVAEVVENHPGWVSIGPNLGDMLSGNFRVVVNPPGQKGVFVQTGPGTPAPVITSTQPYVRLQDVWDKLPSEKTSTLYKVPKTHLGTLIEEDSAHIAAELTLKYFKAMLQDAESLRR